MIKLTNKEFDLLLEIKNFVPVEGKPYKLVSIDNKCIAYLVKMGLCDTRPKEGNGLMLEVVLKNLGLQVLNNEVEHEIVTSRDDINNEEITMEQPITQETTTATEVAPVTNTAPVNKTSFVIEKDIPIPVKANTRARRTTTFPLDQMSVGDSFFVPFKEGEDPNQGRKRIRSNVLVTRRRMLGMDCDWQFVVGIVDNGYRVWRRS